MDIGLMYEDETINRLQKIAAMAVILESHVRSGDSYPDGFDKIVQHAYDDLSACLEVVCEE